MTVAELLLYLEDLPEETQVKVAVNPEWPLEHTVLKAQEIDRSLYLVLDRPRHYLDPNVAEELGFNAPDEDLL